MLCVLPADVCLPAGHIDWAYAYFFSEQAYAGLAGYGYYQLTGDSGAGAVLGDNKSRVYAIGPPAGWFVSGF